MVAKFCRKLDVNGKVDILLESDIEISYWIEMFPLMFELFLVKIRMLYFDRRQYLHRKVISVSFRNV